MDGKKITKHLFECANKFMTLFSFLISHISFISSIDSNFVSTSRPKDIRPHYSVTVCGMGREREVITESDFSFRLAAGERCGRLNYRLSRPKLFSSHSGGGRRKNGLSHASCLSQGENCFCSHNSHNTSPPAVSRRVRL